jgi:pimeloyl-ACP methyl ester carboxylesterase
MPPGAQADSTGRSAPRRLSSGAEVRTTGTTDGRPVILVNGGRAGLVEGDWSASLEWLVDRIAPRRPDLAFHEVRYRIKSWTHLRMCIEDAAAAIDEVARHGPVTMIGFSMGGAVSIAAAGHEAVSDVIGLAPWIPRELDVRALRGRRVTVIHGSLDAGLPGVPGVRPASSRRGADRIEAAGVPVDYTLIRGALHPIAVRAPWGASLPAPRARTWARHVARALPPPGGA